MVSKGGSSTLTQRERKKLAAETKQRKLEEAEAQELAEKETQEQKLKPKNDMPRLPQERLLRWLGTVGTKYITSDKIIQTSVLSLVLNLAHIKYWEEFQDDKEINLLISVACGVLALISALVITQRVQNETAKSNGSNEEVPLPSWNIVYLVFLPASLALVYDRSLLLFNVALTTSVLKLPFIAKLVIQLSILNSNTEHMDTVYNAKVVAGHLVVNYALGSISEFKSLDEVEVGLFSILLTNLYMINSDALYVVILQKLFISFGIGLALLFLITKVYKSNTLLRTSLITLSWTGTFVGATLYQLDPILGNNSLVWIYEYATATDSRIKILSIWLLSLLLLIPTIFNYKIQLSPNFRRKIWHFLVLGLLVYPLHLDSEFVKVSLAGSLILFLLVEQIRYLKLNPFGSLLDSHLRLFADFRDEKGPIIVSYIYLFIGITLPILFNNSIVGLVVLGVGDSLASIIGSNYGTIYWGRSKKTIEGTLTFIVSTYAVCAFLKHIGWFFVDKTFHSLLLTCTLSGILEGNSDLNDNILIPGFMAATLEVLE
ncbi:Dolichol kinase [Wickerhamomyces ciferrii]|uniref:dolichol kinase n=1 Tax=Wickerhamomyces ciferrii (strain ATCC 14091 / BCRC 22168 / CBS 111 / JCM 3599 / NBRC 0793 / NRRL Y-1031 F-60-10) TaxID=1206466 RepID=K0KNJ7_WICCF|nr:Dolichol kinase [Wickerhamomyces ciferrii]CCH46815.1 Dolichol kinase [Wickerhamomyces ciferrii]